MAYNPLGSKRHDDDNINGSENVHNIKVNTCNANLEQVENFKYLGSIKEIKISLKHFLLEIV